MNNEFGENNWSIKNTEEIRNGFENPYYIWTIAYKDVNNEEKEMKLNSKNSYGLRDSFDKYLTKLYKKEMIEELKSDDFKVKITSVNQTVTHDENEYIKKYKHIYSFNKEMDWNQLLREHHYIRVEMKSVDNGEDSVEEIKKYLNQFDNVEFIYFIGNTKYKLLKMHGEVIQEQLLANNYNDYRAYFLKNHFKY